MTTVVEEKVRCPVCNMVLPVMITPGFNGRFKVLCVSKTCKKLWVIVDTRITTQLR